MMKLIDCDVVGVRPEMVCFDVSVDHKGHEKSYQCIANVHNGFSVYNDWKTRRMGYYQDGSDIDDFNCDPFEVSGDPDCEINFMDHISIGLPDNLDNKEKLQLKTLFMVALRAFYDDYVECFYECVANKEGCFDKWWVIH